ncbi:hypothetical protein BKA81DRAFT_361708 [Phyllosticta paracitricarpa]
MNKRPILKPLLLLVPTRVTGKRPRELLFRTHATTSRSMLPRWLLVLTRVTACAVDLAHTRSLRWLLSLRNKKTGSVTCRLFLLLPSSFRKTS